MNKCYGCRRFLNVIVRVFCLMIISSSIFGSETKGKKRAGSSLRTAHTYEGFCSADKQDQSVSDKNKQLQLVAALAKVGWEPSTEKERETGLPEEPTDDKFWLKWHFENHARIVAGKEK